MPDAQRSYVALFLYPDESRDAFSTRLPILGTTAPAIIRAAVTFEGAAAIDVFRLVDASAWPEAAAYLYAETVPGTLADVDGVQQISTPDD